LLLLLLLLLLAFSSFSHLSLFVPCYGTFCAFLWHISLKSLFVLCYGTFCAFPWHILCLPVAHGFCSLLSRIASQELQVKNCKSRIASQELQSRIASQDLQVKNCKKKFLDSLDIFFSRLNE
jgi:hypothetical protein